MGWPMERDGTNIKTLTAKRLRQRWRWWRWWWYWWRYIIWWRRQGWWYALKKCLWKKKKLGQKGPCTYHWRAPQSSRGGVGAWCVSFATAGLTEDLLLEQAGQALRHSVIDLKTTLTLSDHPTINHLPINESFTSFITITCTSFCTDKCINELVPQGL
jgi:hypothetical protein